MQAGSVLRESVPDVWCGALRDIRDVGGVVLLSPVYTIQPVVKPVVKPGCTTGLTTGCIV